MPAIAQTAPADVVRVLTGRDHAALLATLLRIGAPAARISVIAEYAKLDKMAADCEVLCDLGVRLEAWSAHVAATGAAVDAELAGCIARLPELAEKLEQVDAYAEDMRGRRAFAEVARLAGILESFAGDARYVLAAISKTN